MIQPIYIPEFISREQELSLLTLMEDEQMKPTSDRNRFYRWGCPTPYSSELRDTKIPKKILELKLPFDYDSASMNEYYPSQTLDYHFDLPRSGNRIYIISLMNEGDLYFKRKETEFKVVLEPRSLCILHDELRWVWQHSARCKSRRYSIVLRNSMDSIPSSADKYCDKCESYHYLGRGTCND